MPSFLSIHFFVIQNRYTIILKIISSIKSIMDAMSSGIGFKAEETPNISKILNILEPTTFPSAKSHSPFLAATIEVTNSGSDVPKATIVSPISVSLRPKDLAISVALSTTRFPPHIIAAPPSIINKPLFHIGKILYSSSASVRFLIEETISVTKKKMKNPNKIRPFILEITLLAFELKSVSYPKTKSNKLIIIEKGYSLISRACDTLILENSEQAPKTTNKLKILEPIMLLTAIALLPCKPAVILTAASGALVPNATIVKPIIIEGTLKVLATEQQPSTKKSAPLISKIKPMIRKIYINIKVLHSRQTMTEIIII